MRGTSFARYSAGMTRVLIAAVLCSLAAEAGTGPSAASRQPLDLYREALAEYAAGNITGATGILKQLPDSDIRAAITKRWRRPDFSNPATSRELRTAIMAHTETWFLDAEIAALPFYQLHFETARSLVRTLFRTGEVEQSAEVRADRQFVRDWYLTVTAFLHNYMKVGRSRVYIAEARRLFPQDAELMLTEAAGHEMLSGLTKATVDVFDSSGRWTKVEDVSDEKELKLAAEALARAVAAEPGLLEARLRFGRVLYRRGDLDGATRELEAARLSTKQLEIKYLATLFLGMVSASRGELERAATLYLEAIAMMPDGQSAYIALSEVAYRAGRVNEAASIVKDVLGRTLKDDPWWSYQLGASWHLDFLVTKLRERIQR